MNILRKIDSDAVATLTFDRPGSSANVFDRDTLDEFDAHLAALESVSGLRGVVLRTAKPAIFIAGADLHTLVSAAQDPVALGEIVDRGHAVFARLARLPSPTVAAIHGMCLGGGLELALACDWRVASDADETRLGLPETQLGILPAWGGSVRLPALLGLASALPLILTGRRLAAGQALRAGLVDAVAHAEYLDTAALRLLSRGKRPPLPLHLANRPLLRHLVAWRARLDVVSRTFGHYPALLEAVSVCTAARGLPPEKGFALEKDALLALVSTPEARNLMGLFFLRERAKKSPSAAIPAPGPGHHAVAVVGAGVMGAGIAQWLAAHDRVVRLQEVSPEALAHGLRLIEAATDDARRHRKLSAIEARATLDRITPVPADGPLHDVGWVIEAAVEKLEVKQAIFRRLESRVSAETILATNTSALSIGAISSGLEHPERVVGLHFFNPVSRMPLVEIVRGPSTSPAVVDAARRFVLSLDKLPVVARDRPGFLVNRILIPGLVEAVRLFREGLAVREVDRLLLEFGLPMGPLRLADEVGLDIALHVARDLAERLPHLAAPDDTLDRMLAHGWFGKKSGRGFYEHDGRQSGRRPNPKLPQLRLTGPGKPSNSADSLERVVFVMVNEAARCLDEQVAEAPEDIDFAMILGTGWAPFRGGPLRHADAVGIPALVGRLEALASRHGAHLAPCARLQAMARASETFYPPLHPSLP